MKQLLLLSLFALIGSAARSQSVLEIIVQDRMSKDALTHARLIVHTSASDSTVQYTNRLGVGYYKLTSDTISIRCEHISYGTEQQQYIRRTKGSDTLKVVMYLRFETSLEVTIRPPGRPDTIYRSQRLSVSDFDFLPDGRFLLLAYSKNLNKGTELLLYDEREVLGTIPLEEKGTELIRDYRGNVHVITANNVFGISAQGNEVAIGGLEKNYFMTYIAPIVDTTATKYFFSNFNPDYPAFNYFTYDLADSSYRKIAHVEDELMMELYRSEYKWADIRIKLWAKEKENETGVDAEIWVGANYFTQSVYYKELYAPMFERNDTVFVFDHYKSLLFRYDRLGNSIDSLPIFHHFQAKQSGWETKLIQDQTTGQVYSVYEKAGKVSLRLIDLTTGEMKETVPLHFKYPEKILIRGNSVYYTYRPFETAQKKYLYREKLPFNFGTALINNGDAISAGK